MTDAVRRVVLAVAPNGGRRTKADHPAIPLTAPEIAASAAACLDAGASMLHLHVRDGQGRHLLDADAYRQATAAVRRAVGDRLVLQITSESLGVYGPAEQRRVVLETAPEAASLALREFAPAEGDEAAFSAFLGALKRRGIWPQIILYTPDEALRLEAMRRRGLIPFDDVAVIFPLGRHKEGQRSSPCDLLPFLGDAMPRFATWMVCAFGGQETACVTAATLLGADARVGFENNLLMPDGTPAPSNAALVAAAARALDAVGLRLANAAELRERIAKAMA